MRIRDLGNPVSGSGMEKWTWYKHPGSATPLDSYGILQKVDTYGTVPYLAMATVPCL
jgi:hypothetical protein